MILTLALSIHLLISLWTNALVRSLRVLALVLARRVQGALVDVLVERFNYNYNCKYLSSQSCESFCLEAINENHESIHKSTRLSSFYQSDESRSRKFVKRKLFLMVFKL